MDVRAHRVVRAHADPLRDEASVHRCVILGIDIGGLLALMFVAGWFALATIPLGGGALLIWAAVAIVLFIRSRNKAA
jgi:hypothetical protein